MKLTNQLEGIEKDLKESYDIRRKNTTLVFQMSLRSLLDTYLSPSIAQNYIYKFLLVCRHHVQLLADRPKIFAALRAAGSVGRNAPTQHFCCAPCGWVGRTGRPRPRPGPRGTGAGRARGLRRVGRRARGTRSCAA